QSRRTAGPRRESGIWIWVLGPGPPHFEISLPDFFGDAENCWIVVSVVGRTWAVGLRHRCAPRRYDAPPVTRPTVTEIKRNAKDRTAAERMRRYRARERW